MSSVVPSYHDDYYRFVTEDERATIEMTRLHSGRDGEIRCEVEVRWNERPLDGLLHHGTLNLLSDRTVKTLANTLASRVNDLDWYGVLTVCTYMAKDRYRKGEPPIRLAEVSIDRPRWLLPPLLEMEGPTVVAAPGGSNKSLLGLVVAATVATGRATFMGLKPRHTGPVLYLDWESDRFSHQNRMAALCEGAGVDMPRDVFYRREYAPLTESADELRRHVDDMGAVMVVIDSKGSALSGPPEEAEGVLRFFRAVRKLNVPAFVVDHVTHSKRDRDRPFGSVYTVNIARNVWIAKQVVKQRDSTTMLLVHTKSNNGPVGRKIAIEFAFEMDDDNEHYTRIDSRQVNPIGVTDLSRRLDEMSMGERIVHETKRSGGPVTVQELVDLTGFPASSLRRRLSDLKDRGLMVNVSTDKEGRWLAADDYRQQEMGGLSDEAQQIAP